MAKKRRRLNTKFLVVLGLVGCVGLAGIVGGYVWLKRRGGPPNPYWAQAQQKVAEAAAAEAAGRPSAEVLKLYDEAANLYKEAEARDPYNPEGLVRYGDVLVELSATEAKRFDVAMEKWRRALEVNPRHAPAIARLMNVCQEEADAALARSDNRAAEVYKALAELAKRQAVVNPADARARAMEHVAALGQWVSGTALGDREVRAALEELRKLQPQVPDEWRIPDMVARANLQLARNREAADDSLGARNAREDAEAAFKKALDARPKDPAIAFRYALFHRALLDQRTAEAGPAAQEQVQRLLDAALANCPPDHPDYVQIRVQSAAQMAYRGQMREAIASLEALHKERPTDHYVRIALARLCRELPDTRPRALELLNFDVAADRTLKGTRARLRDFVEWMRLIELTTAQAELFPTVPEDRQEAYRREMQKNLDKAIAKYGENASPTLTKLRGQLLVLEGGPSVIRGIQVLREAYDAMERRKVRPDRDLMLSLARLYARIQEDGQLRFMLQEIVRRFPTDVQARKQLVAMLIGTYSTAAMEQAEGHLQELDRQSPRDASVAALRVQLATARAEMQPDEAQRKRQEEILLERVRAMPHQTHEERVVKFASLYSAGVHEEALQALTALSNEELARPLSPATAPAAPPATGPASTRPVTIASMPATNLLIRILMHEGAQNPDRKTQALQLTETALARLPGDPTLLRFRAVLTGTASEDDKRQAEADAIRRRRADPARALVEDYYRLRLERKNDEALAVLRKAEEASPGNLAVIELIFGHALDLGNEPLARESLAKLEKADADRAGGLYYRARYQLAKGEFDAALASATQLSQQMGGLSRTWLLLGMAQQAKGQLDAAVTSYEKALSMQTVNPDALRGLVQCHLELGNITAAQVYIDRGIKLVAGPQRAFFEGASRDVTERVGDPASVTAAREADHKARPDDPRTWAALAENYVLIAGKEYRSKPDAAKENLAKARDLLAKALEKWPDLPVFYRLLARAYAMEKNTAEGTKVLERFVAHPKFKDTPEPYLTLAAYLQVQGPEHHPRAEENYKLALARSNNSPAVRDRLVSFYLQTAQRDKAVAMLRQMLDEAKDKATRRQLIEALVRYGDPAEARRTLAAEPDRDKDGVLLGLWGWLQLMDKDLKGAEASLTEAVRLEPGNAPAWYNLGLIRRAHNDLRGAAEALTRARDLDTGSNVDIRLSLATVHRQRGFADKAAEELEQAVKAHPIRKDLRAILVNLYADQARWAPARQLIEDAQKNPDLNADPVWWQLESALWTMQKRHDEALAAIQKAFKMETEQGTPSLNTVRIMLEVMLARKDYRTVLATTDPIVQRGSPAEGHPWWFHLYRGQARWHLDDKEAAMGAGARIGEFDLALSAVDRAQDDTAAASVAAAMISTVGLDATVEKLRHRVNPRWTLEMATAYLTAGKWEPLVKILDGLLGTDFETLSETQRLRALRLAGQGYTAAAGTFPDAIDKGIDAGRRYVDLAERRGRPLLERLDAYNNLAVLLADHPTLPAQERAKALDYSRKAYEIMRNAGMSIPEVTDTHGWVLVQNAKLDEGMDLLREAMRADRPPVDAYYHLGVACLRKERATEAVGYLQTASDRLKERREKGQMVDPSMEKKVATALEDARRVAKPASAGNTP